MVCGRKGRARANDDQSIPNCSVSKWSSFRTPLYDICVYDICVNKLGMQICCQDHIHTGRELHSSPIASLSHQRVELSAVPFEAIMPSQHDADNHPLLGDSHRLHLVGEAAVNALPLPEDLVSGP